MVGSVQTLSSFCADDFTKAASGINTKILGLIEVDEHYIKNLTSVLREPLQTFCGDLMKEDLSTSVDKVDNFEVSTRSKLLSFVQTLLAANKANDSAMIQQSIEDILQFTREVIDVCACLAKRSNLGINTAQLRKLPFLLLEDTVETLPTALVQIIWRFGASTWLETILCKNGSTLFHQGSRYCLIRMCNKLLKNLSVSAQDEAAHFAGEISMILASVFPLSERSAVNVLGAFHVDTKYQVEYETLEEWMEGGSGHDTSTTNGGSYGKGKKVALNYGFYSKFWAIQKVLTDPRLLLPKTSNPQWNQNIDNFIMNVQDVLGTFEGYEFAEDLVKHLKARWNSIKLSKVDKTLQMKAIAKVVAESGITNDDVEMEDAESKKTRSGEACTKRQYKYLTNSQLLHLQLQDPEIRVHFLSQLFILSAFLSKSLSNFVLTMTGATTANKMTYEKLQSSVQELEKRAGDLMKEIPPNGELHFSTLQWILRERESSWRHWKSKKCMPAIEKFALSAAAKDDDIASKRRKLMGGSKGEIKTAKANAATYLYKIDLIEDLPKISQVMSQHGSAMDHFFEEYVDALDPEAGIEEEYHPKNNKLSSWRALRMLSRKHIGHLGDENGFCMIQKKSGDFEGIVRKIWKEEKGRDIPGDMPKEEEIFDDEMEKDDTSEISTRDESEDNQSLAKNDMEVDGIADLGKDKEEGEKIDDNPVLDGATAANGDNEDDGEIDESDDTHASKKTGTQTEEEEHFSVQKSINSTVDVGNDKEKEPSSRKRKRNDEKQDNKNSNGKSQTQANDSGLKESRSAKESNMVKVEKNQESKAAASSGVQDNKKGKSDKDTKLQEHRTDENIEHALTSEEKVGVVSAGMKKKTVDDISGQQDSLKKEQHKSDAVPTQHDTKVTKLDNEGTRSITTRKKDGNDSASAAMPAQGKSSATANTAEKDKISTSRRGSSSSNRNKGGVRQGRQPESRSQTNQPPQRRIDNRSNEHSSSPQPPSQKKREQDQDSRGGQGTHTRFISPPPTGRSVRDDRGLPRQQHGRRGGGGQRQFNDSARPRGSNEPRDGRGNGHTDRRSNNDSGRGGGRSTRQGGRRYDRKEH